MCMTDRPSRSDSVTPALPKYRSVSRTCVLFRSCGFPIDSWMVRAFDCNLFSAEIAASYERLPFSGRAAALLLASLPFGAAREIFARSGPFSSLLLHSITIFSLPPFSTFIGRTHFRYAINFTFSRNTLLRTYSSRGGDRARNSEDSANFSLSREPKRAERACGTGATNRRSLRENVYLLNARTAHGLNQLSNDLSKRLNGGSAARCSSRVCTSHDEIPTRILK